MKYARYILSVILALVGLVSHAQNELRVPDLEGGAGKTVSIPVYLSCRYGVAAVQFDIQLPFSKASGKDVTLNATRADGHTVSVRSLGSNKYTIVVVSMNNREIIGNGGQIVNIPMTVPADAVPGSVHDIKLSKVVLADKKGNNTLNLSTDGKFTIQSQPSPDLEVTNVNIAAQSTDIGPGATFNVNWNVANTGELATGAGWSETIYLVSPATGATTQLRTVYCQDILEAGQSRTRMTSVTLPEVCGMDGDVTIRVALTPSGNCGELQTDRGNNTAETETTLNLSKYITITCPVSSVKEGQTARFTITRTGDRTIAETFPLKASLQGVLDMPQSLTIPAGQSSAGFYATVVENEDVNEYDRVIVSVDAANGYEAQEIELGIEDNDLLPMSIKLDKSEYNEGETMKLTVTIPKLVGGIAPNLSFSIEQAKRFKLPASYTFDHGALSAVIDIPILQDNTPANPETIKLTVSADHYTPASTLFVLNDDDVPAISFSVQPGRVAENAGSQAIFATVRREGATDSKITIKLDDGGSDAIYFGNFSTITMPPGTTEVNFPLGVKDNQTVDGDRDVNVTAQVYITDCGCSAIGDKQTSVTQTITIIDNDGPWLALTSDKSTILEGDAAGATITVTRNTSTEAPLVVTLESDAEDVEFPATVTIPAGQKSVSFKYTALSNQQSEGDRTVSINADGGNYGSGSTWLLISDRTLADLEIVLCELYKEEVAVGENHSIALSIDNVGAADVLAGTIVRITQDGKLLTNYALPEDIPAGSGIRANVRLTAPALPGQYTIRAELNPDKTFAELQYMNNVSKDLKLTVTSLYKFTSHVVGANIFQVGQDVPIEGFVTNQSDEPVAGIALDVWVELDGSRIFKTVESDKEGRFYIEHAIADGMSGDYTFGACNQGEKDTEAHGTFYVLGFERADNGTLQHKLYVDEQQNGTIRLRNLSSQPLHNIRAMLPDNTGSYTIIVTGIDELKGNQTASVDYSIVSTAVSRESGWDKIPLRFTSDEGCEVVVNTYNHTYQHTPNLAVDPRSISTTVAKGSTRNYPVTISNTGQGETGEITISLPQGMSDFVGLATPTTMPSLAYGEEATAMLTFTAGEDLDVNLIQKGSIAINCANGNGQTVYFSVKVVGEQKGDLVVKVQDENTIYGNAAGEHPYLPGAQIEVKDYNTGAVIVSGITGQDGTITFPQMDEGYYRLHVTADKHDSYDQNILINPAETTTHIATLSYQAISVTWDVQETTVQDEYEIVTSLSYETSVPVPVVIMTAPDTLLLENIAIGKSAMMNVVLRNKGWVIAREVTLTMPKCPGYTFTPLVDITDVDLGAEQSYIVPVRVTHESDASGFVCQSAFGLSWGWTLPTGNRYTSLTQRIVFAPGSRCSSKAVVIPTVVTGKIKPVEYDPVFHDPVINTVKPIDGTYVKPVAMKLNCVTCECLCTDPMPTIPADGKAQGELDGTIWFGNTAGAAADVARKAKQMVASSKCVTEPHNGLPDLLQAAGSKMYLYYSYFNTLNDFFTEKTGAPQMVASIENPSEFYTALAKVDEELKTIVTEKLQFNVTDIPDVHDAKAVQTIGQRLASYMPHGVSNWFDFTLRGYAERMLSAIKDDLEPGSVNCLIDKAAIKQLVSQQDAFSAQMVKYGCATWNELAQASHKDYNEYALNETKNVCTTVKLEISQKLVLTRQAFRGTLTIDNGTMGKLTGVNALITATAPDGSIATSHEMQINVESITGFSGDKDGEWTLEPGQKGVATFLFIPTKYAAPEEPVTYSFGGTLYYDEGNGLQSRSLYPVALQVKPSPELDLTYFMQRDVYGDNALTPDVVEPSEPAEFSVLINNKGNGDATDVRMMTDQPQIVGNDNGEIIEFKIESSSLNGGRKNMAWGKATATEFGDIPAKSSAWATWDLTCSLLGHFKDYDVSYTHLTSYGNPDLSLLNQVTIHELIHSVDVDINGNQVHGWLTNDYEDGHAMPDHIYLNDGSDHDVSVLTDVTSVKSLGDNRYEIDVNVPTAGWFYIGILNPGNKHAAIRSVRLSQEGSKDMLNFWATKWLLQDGIDPQEDNRLHVCDYAGQATHRTYIVEYEPSPEVELEVKSIATVPADEDIAEEVIEELTVTFNKGIRPETFTREDITVRYEGQKQSIAIPISKVNDSTYKLDTRLLNENGYYALEVRADGIIDNEDFAGYNGRMVRWMLFKDGLVHYNVGPWPHSSYGTIQSSTSATGGEEPFGSTITLKALPLYGHKFAYWGLVEKPADLKDIKSARRKAPSAEDITEDKIVKLSTDPTMEIELRQTSEIVAVFDLESYKVNVSCDDEQGTMSLATGFYDYGTTVNVDAAARDGYTLAGFVINGVNYTPEEAADYTIEGETDIQAVFTEDCPTLLLQEDEVYTPAAYAQANVTLKRSFRKGYWNTICLPCAVSDPQATFGSGTIVARLGGLNGNMMQFDVVNHMEPNVPYLIQVGRINNSGLAKGESRTTLFNIEATPVEEPGAEGPVDSYPGITYVGTYGIEPIQKGAGNYYISSNKLYYIDAKANVNTGRFRGYFRADEPSGIKLYLNLEDDDDAIGTIQATQAPAPIYRMDGTLVRTEGQSLQGLAPGLYISGGQKFRVK